MRYSSQESFNKSETLWVGDLGTRLKNPKFWFFGLGLKIVFLLFSGVAAIAKTLLNFGTARKKIEPGTLLMGNKISELLILRYNIKILNLKSNSEQIHSRIP